MGRGFGRCTTGIRGIRMGIGRSMGASGLVTHLVNFMRTRREQMSSTSSPCFLVSLSAAASVSASHRRSDSCSPSKSWLISTRRRSRSWCWYPRRLTEQRERDTKDVGDGDGDGEGEGEGEGERHDPLYPILEERRDADNGVSRDALVRTDEVKKVAFEVLVQAEKRRSVGEFDSFSSLTLDSTCLKEATFFESHFESLRSHFQSSPLTYPVVLFV
mmetsp:Transcript_5909/g.9070  ORF Transcript_5909/g.9070 Transcript_5909/m.9070 type:complete len:216 (-) Transcript_5909:332-979(-)|eukprot:623854-Amorphochlora_amoeboformis.AAC.2